MKVTILPFFAVLIFSTAVFAQDRPCEIIWTKDPVCGEISSNFFQASVNGLFQREIEVGGLPNQIVISSENPPMLYWTDSALGVIRRSDMSFSSITTLISGLTNPQGLALDVPNGKIYWAEDLTSQGVIRRANIDGSGAVDIVAPVDKVKGLQLDLANQKIYWTRYSGGWLPFSDPPTKLGLGYP